MGRGGFGGHGYGRGGYGRGRGGNRGYGPGQGMGAGSGGDCICPDCGKRIPHTPGFPCSEEICPSCGAMMIRDTGQKFKTGKSRPEKDDEKSSKNVSLFPIVDVNLCTGCGICIEKCPFDSIVMKDGKAMIQNDICRKCMICVKVCPENAIA